MCGAWVGGEYRSIHFRTGQLGQGSRTALPICGYFYEAVLGDPAFKHYHGKFAPPQEADLKPDMYLNCRYVYTPRDTDSISVDSLGHEIIEREVDLDEIGNPAVMPKEAGAEPKSPAADNNSEAVEPKKKTEPQYEDVYF